MHLKKEAEREKKQKEEKEQGNNMGSIILARGKTKKTLFS